MWNNIILHGMSGKEDTKHPKILGLTFLNYKQQIYFIIL